MAHRLISGGLVKCGIPHGHNETVTVRLRSVKEKPLDAIGNIIEPFERAKATWYRWIDDRVDHSLHLSVSDPLLCWFLRHEPQRIARILVTSGDPSTEMLACCMMAKLNVLTADGGRHRCEEVRIEETPTNTVTFDGDPSQALPTVNKPDPWWLRADMSINDIPQASKASKEPSAAAAR